MAKSRLEMLSNAKDAYKRGDPQRAARYAELASKHFEKCALYHAEDEGRR